MPRQAARLVLGRSARAAPAAAAAAAATAGAVSHHAFSTTPRHFADNNDETPTRNARSAAVASALGSIAGSSSSSSSSTSRTSPSFARPPPGLGRPGANVISLKSLPQARRPAQLGGSGERPPPGSPNFEPRFGAGGSSGGARGGFGQGATSGRGNFGRGNFGRGNFGRGNFGRGGGGSRGRGMVRGGGGRGGRGGMRGGKNGNDDAKDEAQASREDDLNLGDELLKADKGAMPEDVEEYIENNRIHGPERPYAPSTTLESLVHWGPAVATNNALGQAATAARSIRLMGGGRRFHEHEQSFDIIDEIRWRSENKPILYSRVEQKAAALKMLAPGKRERLVQKAFDEIVSQMQAKHGKNWTAFAEEYDNLGEDEIRRRAEEKIDASFERRVNDLELRGTKNKRTMEAISKFVLKGESPQVKNGEDTLAKAALYHAHTPTYRPVDGDKFDAKLKQLVRS
ncbi:unnamed protein product [Discula destructiva]